jgi:hypothetical protein
MTAAAFFDTGIFDDSFFDNLIPATDFASEQRFENMMETILNDDVADTFSIEHILNDDAADTFSIE